MATVTISGKTYTVYGDVAAADEYLGGSVTADAWRAADADTKARSLVSAARWIDAQSWVEAFDTFAKREAEPAFVNASFELAAGFAGDADFQTSFAAVQAKRIKAGSVEIENFRGSTVQVSSVFPTAIMAMIGKWLAGRGGAGFAGSVSFGTCRETNLDQPYDFRDGL